MELLEWIKGIDTSLSLTINGWNNPFGDHAMYIYTRKEYWVLFYLILLCSIKSVYGKRIFYVAVVIAITIACTDQICNLFKYGFERPRPGHDPIIGDLVHIFYKKGGRFGFISGHSGNSFALAAVIFRLVKSKPLHLFMLGWAALVAISRVWLGVHYVGDIVCGGVIGYLIGWGIYLLANRFEASICRGERKLNRVAFTSIENRTVIITLLLCLLLPLIINTLYITQGYIG